MATIAVMSSKLPLVSRDGFSLDLSHQKSYTRPWHVHDCPMLFWPRAGVICGAWTDSAGEREHTLTLAYGTAVLVPANVGHAMRSDTRLQQHGELYFAPDLLRDCKVHGAVLLDRASRAMLEALSSPELHRQSASQLIRAFIQQLARSRPLAVNPVPTSAPERLAQLFLAALESGSPLPSIDAAAMALGLSARSLQRQCLEQLGAAPVTLRRRILAEAAQALLAKGMPLPEVSAQLGFANSGHLNRLLNGVIGSDSRITLGQPYFMPNRMRGIINQ
ncbi:MAG: helix-turn-helix domain-containing protein [Pusillimonas sp.]